MAQLTWASASDCQKRPFMACSSIDSLPPISASTVVAMLGNRGVSRVLHAVLSQVQTQHRPTYGTVKRNSYNDDGAGKKLPFRYLLVFHKIFCPCQPTPLP